MMKISGKIDISKVVKRSSRDFFYDIDTRNRVIESKKRYNRKQKHKNKIDI